MIRFLADQNFDMSIARGVWRMFSEVEILHVSEIELSMAGDDEILEYAARYGYAVISHDARTMPIAAFNRLARGLPMCGLFIVPDTLPIGLAIEEISIIVNCSSEHEWHGRVTRLPL